MKRYKLEKVLITPQVDAKIPMATCKAKENPKSRSICMKSHVSTLRKIQQRNVLLSKKAGHYGTMLCGQMKWQVWRKHAITHHQEGSARVQHRGLTVQVLAQSPDLNPGEM